MKTQKKYDIFISYRRGSGLYMAKNISQALEKRGYNVFFDYNSLENGQFNTQIYDAIEVANDFILVLSENALTDCINENDWVKNEIIHAKKYNKNIILAQDEKKFIQWPFLPQDIDFLKTIDWTPINPKLFEGSINLLCSRLKSPKPSLLKTIKQYKYFFLAMLAVIFAAFIYIYYPLSLVYRESDFEDFTAILPVDFSNDVSKMFDEIVGNDYIEVLFAFSSDDGSTFTVMEEDIERGIQYIYGEHIDKTQLAEIIETMDMDKYKDLVITALTSAKCYNFKTSYKILFMQKIPFIEYEDDNSICRRAIMYNFDDEVFRNIILSISKKNKNFIERKRYFRAFDKMIKSFKEFEYTGQSNFLKEYNKMRSIDSIKTQ